MIVQTFSIFLTLISITILKFIISSELIRLHEFTGFNMNLMLFAKSYIFREYPHHYHNVTTTKLQSIKGIMELLFKPSRFLCLGTWEIIELYNFFFIFGRK